MAQLINVLVGLSTALIGFIIGQLWRRIADWIAYRRIRGFWAPMLRGNLQVVVSRFVTSAFPEPTGLVGGGDALALRELSSYFSDARLKRFNFVYVDEHDRLDTKSNLVLLGGLDTNEVTRAAMERIKPGLTIVDPGPGNPMEVHDLIPRRGAAEFYRSSDPPRMTYKAMIHQAGSGTDYGIIIRAKNPFKPEEIMVIIAGAYGYGTWGGVQLTHDAGFLRMCEQIGRRQARNVSSEKAAYTPLRSMITLVKAIGTWRHGRVCSEFECLFSVDVFSNRPQAKKVIVFRRLPKRLKASLASCALHYVLDPPLAPAARLCSESQISRIPPVLAHCPRESIATRWQFLTF